MKYISIADIWIGKNLFHPIIIKICHMLTIGQYFFSRMSELLWFMFLLWGWSEEPHSWFAWTIITILGVLIVVFLELHKDRPRKVSAIFRAIWFGILISDSINLEWKFIIADIFQLFCLYAMTLDDLPPAPKSEPKKNTKLGSVAQ